MVKFGRHCRAFAENSPLYVVPYDATRNNLIENVEDKTDPIHRERFEAEWRKCLDLAAADFRKAMVGLWKLVFDGIKTATAEGGGAEQLRGALPDTALRTYLTVSNIDAAQELLFLVKQIYNTALTNAEALRKLVKKFDKQHSAALSVELLPEVYGENFVTGQSTLQAGISLIRASLGLNSDGADDDAASVGSAGSVMSASKQAEHDVLVQRRKEELEWLRQLVGSIARNEIANIVAHRGFHSPMDRSDVRPLENSLAAYETAWSNGIFLCECDIALTKDEKLILAHDEDFQRLALDPLAAHSSLKVGDLTYRQLISMPLKSGNRPPLLIDVLRSASAIGGNSQLIIEIKPGNVAAASALARLFLRHPELMSRCAVVMSFDAFAMHTLRKDLKTVLPMVDHQGPEAPPLPSSSGVSLPSTMSLGNLGYRVDSMPATGSFEEEKQSIQEERQFIPLAHRGKTDSLDHFGVGLTDSIRTRSGSFSFTPFNQLGPQVPQSQGQSQVYDHKISPTTPTTSPKLTGIAAPNLRSSPNLLASTSSPAKTSKVLLPPRGDAPQQPLSPRRFGVPKLMLLTVAQEPKIECELVVHVSDILQVEQWLGGGDGALDGAYLQFEKEMLTKEGAASLRKLSDKGYSVGVW
eukprot:CAMPEP_0181026902 /NCGR_PEP_ID=MMETSP1070-20121207/3886_1 /TAXON_ID=265543 /ORGANISM="Minutocellus polymorphus, Strain NH13" /LENGTH=637 /DNA_ID=CAMNT_0023104123 /DNA_START=37 /DNA_END=1947 /DNA_ORIENTATION=-